jgi:hypothetical protein
MITLTVLLAPEASLPLRATSVPARADGLWQGYIFLQPAQIEMDVTVEIAPQLLAGTIDLPVMWLRFHPLQNIQVEGSKVAFDFDRQLDKQDPDDVFRFRGEVAPDGKTISGKFTGLYYGMNLDQPFELRRLGEAGSERPVVVKPPLVVTPAGEELRAAFNRDKDKVRLVLLLSPTCDLCMSSAGIVQKYVLGTIKDDKVAVYTVWGPMYEADREEHAREATVRMPDPRVTHFWTAGQTVAEKFAQAIKAPDGVTGWDTFQLFPPGATWGDSVPAPARYMFMRKPLPEELTLHGEKLAEWVLGYLRARP